MTTVSFVMPVRNEEEYIRGSLQSLAAQEYPAEKLEILVVDGRSSDRTREVIDEVSCGNPQIRCLDNPAGIVPTAMNIGIRAARGEVIIRADGHNIYPSNYAANCVKYLYETGADNVGGPWLIVPADASFGARLVATILRSPFGVGNSKFRISAEAGFVDTVPFGAFRREIFDRVGMYNEKLVRNQDNELNARIRRAGGRIYLTPELTTQHYPVKNFRELLKHALKTSRWHIFTLGANRQSMGPRHLAPAIFLTLLVVMFFASLTSTAGLIFLILILCVYFLAGFYFSLYRERKSLALGLLQPFASFCFHMAYGVGTLIGLVYLFRQPPVKPIRPGLSIQSFQEQPIENDYGGTDRKLTEKF